MDAIYLNPGEAILFGKTTFIGSFQSMFENSKKDSSSLDIRFRIVDRQITDDQAVDIGTPLKTPFNCQPLIYDKLFKTNLHDTSLSLSHLTPAKFPRDASSRLVPFEFA